MTRTIIIKYKSINHATEPDDPKKYHTLEVDVPPHCFEIKSIDLVETIVKIKVKSLTSKFTTTKQSRSNAE